MKQAAASGTEEAGSPSKNRIYRVGPRRELFESEPAAVLFHGFLALGRTDQYRYADAVQRELTARQPRDTHSRRAEEAIRAMREAAVLEDGPPSMVEWAKWISTEG
jgi:hypothetical protein